jgi:hypothetical protein
MIAIVDSNGPANIGSLWVDLGPVGNVTDGYRPRFLATGQHSQPYNALWLAFFTEALSDVTWS